MCMCVCVCVCVMLLLLWHKNVCIHTCMCWPFVSVRTYIYCLCAPFVCRQVQNELSQTTEKLLGEVAQRQQLSEEFEQVVAVFFVLSCLTRGGRGTSKLSVDNITLCVCVCAVNLQAQKTVTELQAQLDLLKDSAESPQADTEDVAQLKVR